MSTLTIDPSHSRSFYDEDIASSRRELFSGNDGAFDSYPMVDRNQSNYSRSRHLPRVPTRVTSYLYGFWLWSVVWFIRNVEFNKYRERCCNSQKPSRSNSANEYEMPDGREVYSVLFAHDRFESQWIHYALSDDCVTMTQGPLNRIHDTECLEIREELQMVFEFFRFMWVLLVEVISTL
jgi:hypothetical protein